MNLYRFLSYTATPGLYLASVVEAQSLKQAISLMDNRLNEHEDVASINLWDDNQWFVVEGITVNSDQIVPHPDSEKKYSFEGEAVSYIGSTESRKVTTQPKKIGKPLKKIREPEPGNYNRNTPADNDTPWIVIGMRVMTGILFFLALWVFGKMDSEAEGEMIYLLVSGGFLVLAFSSLIATYAMQYLAGIYFTLKRIEDRK